MSLNLKIDQHLCSRTNHEYNAILQIPTLSHEVTTAHIIHTFRYTFFHIFYVDMLWLCQATTCKLDEKGIS